MQIKSITLNNFRQFKGKQVLEFSCDEDKNVTVLLGDNTFGKTTILQAFNWCLYGKTVFPKDSNPDFLLNLELASEQIGVEYKLEVFVELILVHKNVEYIINRKEPYVDKGNGQWKPLSNVLSVSYKDIDGLVKSIREGEENSIINSILPKSLSDYFFFDTERVSDISERKDLNEAVKGLLGLAAVDNARNHLGKRTAKTTVIGSWYNALDDNGDKKSKDAKSTISKETNAIEKYQQEVENCELELEKLNKQKKEIEEILLENKNTAELQKKKIELENKLLEEKDELSRSNKLFLDYYNNGAVTYFMLPLMKKAEETIKNAKFEDAGIRDMTEASIRDIIKKGRCICGQPIISDQNGDSCNEAYIKIMETLKYLPPANIGTSIQNYKQLLDNDRRNCSQFFPTIEQKFKEIQKHRDVIDRYTEEIEKIDKATSGKENMSNYDADMKRIKKDIERMTKKKEECKCNIAVSEKTIESAQKTIDSLITTSERNSKLISFIAYAENICNWINNSYEMKEQQMRDNLQERVNKLFSKMYHGKRRVQIDKQYNVTLFAEINGKEVISGESEGLKRVKNFAFIAGLVDIAKEKASLGKNQKDSITWENESYPLVMDAPFSNADETHIKNISSILPNVANQVIMFVMEKDWQYAKDVMETRVGKYCTLNKISESFTKILL